MPPFGTEEFDNILLERETVLRNAVNNCTLAFDKNFCKYKNSFNYCVFCEKEFRRKER